MFDAYSKYFIQQAMQSFKFSCYYSSLSVASKDCLKVPENTKHVEAENFTQKPLRLQYVLK